MMNMGQFKIRKATPPLQSGLAGRPKHRVPYPGSRVPAVKGFTIIELLVVVAILAILLSLLMPSVGVMVRNMKNNATLSTIEMISRACEMYKEDFKVYPDSSRGSIGGTNNWEGRHVLVQALTGYCPDLEDDGKPSDSVSGFTYDDGFNSYGFKMAKRGKTYGPYNGCETIKMTGAAPRAFLDAYDNEIYYYRFDEINDRYNQDNPTPITPPDVEGNYAKDPTYFYRKDYIILSPGADGTFKSFFDASNKPVVSDDLNNFNR